MTEIRYFGKQPFSDGGEVTMIKRVTAAVGCAAFCLALLTGCSGSGGDNGGKVTLKAVTQFGGDDPAAELFSTIIEEWETDTGNRDVYKRQRTYALIDPCSPFYSDSAVVYQKSLAKLEE